MGTTWFLSPEFRPRSQKTLFFKRYDNRDLIDTAHVLFNGMKKTGNSNLALSHSFVRKELNLCFSVNCNIWKAACNFKENHILLQFLDLGKGQYQILSAMFTSSWGYIYFKDQSDVDRAKYSDQYTLWVKGAYTFLWVRKPSLCCMLFFLTFVLVCVSYSSVLYFFVNCYFNTPFSVLNTPFSFLVSSLPEEAGVDEWLIWSLIPCCY